MSVDLFTWPRHIVLEKTTKLRQNLLYQICLFSSIWQMILIQNY